jgi:branched-chain amino acid transport system substrate-binding protein
VALGHFVDFILGTGGQQLLATHGIHRDDEAINRHFTKVAGVFDSTNYGVSGRDDMLDQIKKQGNKLTVVAQEKFNIGDKDMTAQLLRAKSAGAQAVLIWAIGPELAAVSNGMAKIGMKVPLIGGWTLSMSNYIDNAGKNGNGTLMPQTFIEEPITPKAKSFIEGYPQMHCPNYASACAFRLLTTT